ncbi:Osmotin, thaumatin-like protein [Hesseltinella vesiculosa]|uniref:Osmotin, thaumatin-like protein n=1 Tax=Hesseltinella vesiculosa TaxID=101127 RepID=A0A1X2G2B2_9FUNG|nr:Osmotin, thaumatin-like protein [Hesseltinella vesiculosa]
MQIPYLSVAIISILLDLAAGFPPYRRDASGGSPSVVVKNSCSYSIIAGTSENGKLYGDSTSVSAGQSHTFTYPSSWEGRVWARTSCEGQVCKYSGLWAPTTLAEFNFKPGNIETMYDISLVDGWNLPMTITPDSKTSNPYNLQKHCGTPACKSLPSCPQGFESKDNSTGKAVACQSACSHFQTPEYCCTGAYGENTCKPSRYADAAKSTCPDAYSYAYDDATSVYSCGATSFTVEFCPH